MGEEYPLFAPPPGEIKKKKGPSRKKVLPVWFDPNYKEGDLMISYYVPHQIPEDPAPEEEAQKINAIIVTRAALPKFMTKDEAHNFMETPKGEKWFDEAIEKARNIINKKRLVCPECGFGILPQLKAKKYILVCPGCGKTTEFKKEVSTCQ